ncbi:MAG: RidA family protein [Gammaproteobacteria bacterium]
MHKTLHNPETVFPEEGHYAHGLEVGDISRLMFVSGTMGLNPDMSAPPSFEQQCRLAWSNILTILKSAGMCVENIVRVNTFLASREYGDKNGEIRREVLGEHRVALTVVGAELLDSDWLVEINVTAAE